MIYSDHNKIIHQQIYVILKKYLIMNSNKIMIGYLKNK